MKNIILAFGLLLGGQVMGQTAEELAGSWLGELEAGGAKLRIGLNFEQKSGVWAATMDSPDQGAFDIPFDSVSVAGGKVYARLKLANAYFEGTWQAENKQIKGEWVQGQNFPLALKKGLKSAPPKRTQVLAPADYKSEEVRIDNKSAGLKLAGTLTLPNKAGKHPAVILVTGSGPQNRDEEIMGHRPFAVIADYLTRQGFAVLRLDDRGTGQSTGTFAGSTTADFVTDINAAFGFLQADKRIDKKRIGLLGHSEGGMVAPMLAVENKKVAFVILMAAPGVPIQDVMLRQNRDIALQAGEDEAEIAKSQALLRKIYTAINEDEDGEKGVDELFALIRADIGEEQDSNEVKQTLSYFVDDPWFNYFIRTEPEGYLAQLRCPVLALQGGKDIQVAADDNLPAIQAHLEKAKNKNFTCQLLPDLNHLFQTCKTCTVAEYGQLEETISPEVLQIIAKWLEKNIKK